MKRRAEDVLVGDGERAVAVVAPEHERRGQADGSGNESKPGKFEKKKVPLSVFFAVSRPSSLTVN